jgi:type IV pilus assembly protein PilW
MSLVELMVALTIGSVLIAGAVYVYSQSRTTYRTNESLARLQEQGRYVLSVLEPDIELAGYYGFTNFPDSVRFVENGDPARVIAVATRMRQWPAKPGDPVPQPVVNLPSGAHACGVNFAVDVLTAVQGANDTFDLGRNRAGCEPYGSGAQMGSDTLVVRHADPQPAPAEAGRLQVYASRLSSRSSHLLFADGVVPGVINDDNRVHNLVVRAFYVSRDSVGRPGLPALRVKTLTAQGGGIVFDEDEVMPGVEDLQVQFGIDTGDYNNDGAIDSTADVNRDGIPEADGHATRYVDPDFADLHRYQVVSVRLWVRIRSEERENEADGRTHRYATVAYTPAGDERHYRRIVMSRTITLRNARTL